MEKHVCDIIAFQLFASIIMCMPITNGQKTLYLCIEEPVMMGKKSILMHPQSSNKFNST